MMLLGASGHCLALVLLCVVVASCRGRRPLEDYDTDELADYDRVVSANSDTDQFADYDTVVSANSDTDEFADYDTVVSANSDTDEMDRGLEFDSENFEYTRRSPHAAAWWWHRPPAPRVVHPVVKCPEQSTSFGKCNKAWSNPGAAAQAKEVAALSLRHQHHNIVHDAKFDQPFRKILPDIQAQMDLDNAADPVWYKTHTDNSNCANKVAFGVVPAVVPSVVPAITKLSGHGKIMNAFQDNFIKTTPTPAEFGPWNRSAEADPQLLLNDRWNDDRIFVASRLAGFNPVNIYRIGSKSFSQWDFVRRINFDFGWDSAVLAATGGHCNFWKALEKEMLFVQYHPILNSTTNDAKGPGAFQGKKFLTPLALFVLPQNAKELKVVAIQLDEGAKAKVYTPSTSSFFWWTYAKAIANHANAVQNHLLRHLHNAHFVSERFVMATERELSPSHPVRQLLEYHHRGLHQINSLGSKTLIGPGGATSQLVEVGFSGTVDVLKESFHQWHYRDMNLEDDVKYRGVDKLPLYPYLDDGRDFVKVLREYVDGYVRLHYCCDDLVRDDKALHRWVHYSAVTVLKDAKGLPTKLETVEELVNYISNQLWVLTGYHAAVNYGNGEMDFAPYNPVSIFLRPDQVDETKAAATSPENPDYLINVMGTTWQHAAGTWALGFTLAGFKMTPLIEDTELIRSSSRASLVKHTQAEFLKLEKTIEGRNRVRRQDGLLPYRYLLPSEVTGSIAI